MAEGEKPGSNILHLMAEFCDCPRASLVKLTARYNSVRCWPTFLLSDVTTTFRLVRHLLDRLSGFQVSRVG
jgi:hypothetical protein